MTIPPPLPYLAAMEPSPSTNRDVDTAIIGAGVSGVYSGWRLRQEQPEQSVELFELSDRVGGRLFSVRPNDMPTVRAEVGGMRFLSVQTLVTRLIEHLGLAVRDFPLGDDHNLYYLRGRRFHPSDLTRSETIPYFLKPEEQGRDPRTLMLETMDRMAPGCLKMSPPEFLEARKRFQFEGRTLHDWGFWDLLARFLSVEAIHFIRDAAGYDGITGNVNCADMIALATHHLNQPAKVMTLVDGFDALPKALAAGFEEAGGKLNFGMRLVNLRPESDGRVRLIFKPRGQSATVERMARRVILAMPRRSLELLDLDCPLFESEQFVEDLQSVLPRPAEKLFLTYPRPWWSDLGISSGRSDTDLPLRQCYYFGTEPDSGKALLMAGYHDGESVEFWDGFKGNALSDARLRRRVDGDITVDDPRDVPATLLSEAQRQVRQIHGEHLEIPEPLDGLYFNWQQDPFGGGWHTWRVHRRSEEIMPRIRKPVEDLPVYICGEAYSQEQGWVQGALHTAEHVLQEHFQISRPSFLPADHFMGP